MSPTLAAILVLNAVSASTLSSDNTESMKALTEEVKQLMMEIGQKVYSQTGENEASTGNKPDNEPIETDFSVGN